MEIQNAITIPSKLNQLKNIKTLRVEFRNIIAQPGGGGGINDTKSKFIAFDPDPGMTVT